MKTYIAYCGLDCETCEARLATMHNDNELRKKIAKEWSELNHAEITPEMINCEGCRMDGVKTPYCDSLCLPHGRSENAILRFPLPDPSMRPEQGL